MTDTTNLGTIWVVGQRRPPAGSFPPPGGSAGGGVPDTPGHTIHQAGDDPEPPPATHPCAHPDTALEWNADAAAAEALRRMQADANDPLLDGRERSPSLFRIYLVGTRADPGQPARLQIRVYNQDNLNGDEETPWPGGKSPWSILSELKLSPLAWSSACLR